MSERIGTPIYGPTTDIEPGEALYSIEAVDYPAGMPDGSIEHLMEILGFVADHRYFQDLQHGGPAHDDTHQPHEWEDLIRLHCYRLVDCLMRPNDDYPDRLLKIAAIAVAARQSWERHQARAANAEEG